MSEKYQSTNDKSIIRLHQYLIDIIKNPENYKDSLDLLTLKSQKNLSKIKNSEYGIEETSLNTLKRRAPALFSGGFNELDTLRNQAYDAVFTLRNSKKAKNQSTKDIVEKLNNEIEALKRTQILMTTLFLENLKAMEGLQNISSLEIIKKQLNDLSVKMKMYGMLDKNFLSLTEYSNVIDFKDRVKK